MTSLQPSASRPNKGRVAIKRHAVVAAEWARKIRSELISKGHVLNGGGVGAGGFTSMSVERVYKEPYPWHRFTAYSIDGPTVSKVSRPAFPIPNFPFNTRALSPTASVRLDRLLRPPLSDVSHE